ncbi:YncE family protein [Azospirillum sp. sgz302134]
MVIRIGTPFVLAAALTAAIVLVGRDPPATFAAGTAPLTLERTIPLGNVSGRIDHFAIDLARQRLLIAELGNNTVGVLDLAQGRVIRRLTGLKEPQGVAHVPGTHIPGTHIPGTDAIIVANGGDGTVRRFKATDFAELDTVKLGEDADNIRVDASAAQVIVGYGNGALAALDAVSGRKLGEIRLAAHPESFQLETNGPRIFVNAPDARQIAVVDRESGQQIATWTLSGAGGNFPMALDESAGRLAVVYRKPSTLAVFETEHGGVVARLPTCEDADDVFFDRKRQRLYISCGDGTLAVIQKQDDGQNHADSYRELGRIPTVPGARTSLWVPELDRLFLGVRANGREPAAVWVYRPAP